MKMSQIFVLSAATVALSASVPAQSLPTQKVLPFDLAQTIAQEAMSACRANGYKVTVTVVDSANVVRVLLRDDGARPATVQIGQMKATTAISSGRPSGPPANLPPGTPVPAPVLPGTINAQGGVPIKAGDDLIGAVAVSGAPGGDKDEACANAALAKVADRLK
jgi:uncharacterized protein GlcG (DUF336 family)